MIIQSNELFTNWLKAATVDKKYNNLRLNLRKTDILTIDTKKHWKEGKFETEKAREIHSNVNRELLSFWARPISSGSFR